MFASLSYEARILQKMRALDVTADFLSALAQIPPYRLSQAWRSIKALTPLDGEKFLDLLTRMEELAASVAPTTVSFKNPEVIRGILASRRSK